LNLYITNSLKTLLVYFIFSYRKCWSTSGEYWRSTDCKPKD